MQNLRLRYGLFWRGKYPPVARPLFLLFMLALLYTLASTMDYHVTRSMALEHEQEVKDAYKQVVLNCATQAVQGGNVGVIIGKELFGMDCTLLSRDAYEGVKL